MKCGKEIVDGVNGCQLLDECFICHGGYPKYAKSCTTSGGYLSWEELDILEDRCLNDGEDP